MTNWKIRLKRFIIGFAVLLLIIISMAGGIFYAIYSSLESDLPSIAELEDKGYQPPLRTKVFAADSTLLAEFYIENRVLIPLDSIPDLLINAFLAIEDKSFYSHWGISLKDIMRAAWVDIKAGKIVQGASTITQQLAKELFLTKEKTFIRKIKEALLAMKLEQRFSKEEILFFYLNQIYLGDGTYGVQAAAQNYFGKGVRELSIMECATIAGLPQSPENYNPRRNVDAAVKRRNIVLRAMASEKHITPEQAKQAMQEDIYIVPRKIQAITAPYFVEEVRRYLLDRYTAEMVYKQGVTVYTTLNPVLQAHAEQSVENQLRRIEDRYNFPYPYEEYENLSEDEIGQKPPYLQAAVTVIDPKTGSVLAMVGGRNFQHSEFNRATQAKRQPGSSFKPFVYTAAIDNGITPSELILDAPLIEEAGGEVYKPHNYDNKFHGMTTLRCALENSFNVCAVKLLKRVGAYTVTDYAHKMGIESFLGPYYSLALGGEEVTLLEMTSAYGTLANQGVRIHSYLIQDIIDRNNIPIYEHRIRKEEAISPQTAYLVTHLLEGVLDRGTGVPARLLGFDKHGAGKTGTTNNYTDAWFMGFTPNLVTGVWVGYDELKRMGRGLSGAVMALPIWTEFMIGASDTLPDHPFPCPSGIIHRKVCLKSGKLATLSCPITFAEAFVGGSAPTDVCDIHQEVYDFLPEGEIAKNQKPVDYDKFELLDSRSVESKDFNQ